jgi:hypothetical protein
MTPSIVKNVVRMPKLRARQVRTRISYMTSEQLERFLRAAKEHGPREHAMFLFAVAHGAVGHQLPQRAGAYRPAEGFASIHSELAESEG